MPESSGVELFCIFGVCQASSCLSSLIGQMAGTESTQLIGRYAAAE